MACYPQSSSLTCCRLVVLLLLAVRSVDGKKNRDAPHPHGGLLSPYKAGPFTSFGLTNSDLEVLDSGKAVMKQSAPMDGELAGGAICVQDIRVPKEQVWEQILNFNAYKGKVPKVNECTNYCDTNNKDGTRTIKTKMVLGVIPGYAYTAYYDHTYHADQDSLTWTLDYDKTSDFDDVSGHWHLEAHPEKPDCTRVFYACDIKLRGAIPKPVVNDLSKSALRTATGWVKKESEIQSEVAVEEESTSSGSSGSSSSSGSVEEHEESPASLTFTKDEIRALASGKPVKNLVTLNLNKGDMKTLNSKRQLTTQVAAKDGDARATISVLQVIEAPKLALLERFKDSVYVGLIIAALIIGLSSLL